MQGDVATILERVWHAWAFLDMCNESQNEEAEAELDAAEAELAQILQEPGELWLADTGKAAVVIQPGVVMADGKLFDLSDSENAYNLLVAMGLNV